MNIEEAKKVIEMCADAVKKGDGEDAKIYVNKEYVLSILDMVERAPQITGPDDPYPYPWYPTQPGQPGTYPVDPMGWPPGYPQVWYKDHTDGSNPDFEKVPWWVWYKDYNQFTCDATSTGSKPTDADVVMTSANTADQLRNTAQPGMFANITDKDKQATLTDELKRLREYQSMNAYSAESSEPTHLYEEKFTTTGPVRDTKEGTHTI